MASQRPRRKFEGQVGVITGGAKGIGLGIVNRLASEGLKTVIFDLDEDEAKQQLSLLVGKGYDVDFVKVDVSDEQSVSQGFDYVATKYGRLDVMVNSAGIFGPSNRLVTDVSVDEFDKVQKINVRGSFLVTKYAITRRDAENELRSHPPYSFSLRERWQCWSVCVQL